MMRRIWPPLTFVLLACGIVVFPPASVLATILAHSQAAPPAQSPRDVKLPLEDKSVRFAVIGDNGTGDPPQYEVAAQMEAYRKIIGYDFVTMMGDNIYGGHKPKDIERKFDTPYKPLLDAGVKFYACLG